MSGLLHSRFLVALLGSVPKCVRSITHCGILFGWIPKLNFQSNFHPQHKSYEHYDFITFDISQKSNISRGFQEA